MKEKIRGRDKFKKYKKLLYFFSNIIKKTPKKLRIKLYNSIRNINGNLGIALRYIILRSLIKKCGDNISVHPNVFLFGFENLSIGDNVSIHPMCYIDATGGIIIKNDVSIAHNSSILSTEHNFNSDKLSIKDQGLTPKKTLINSNVWIASGVRVLAGAQIGEGTIIAAGAVVKKIVTGNSIYGGIPAKFIKERVM